MQLTMQSLFLTGQILPVGARLWVRHEFQCNEPQPVEVIYAFALPRDATLRRFRISGDGFDVASELRSREEARKEYEDGIAQGSLSSLATIYGDCITNLSVGNIRPGEKVVVLLEMLAGAELHDDGLRFRFPFALAPCYHAKARAIESESGIGEMELPENEFGDLMLPKFKQDARDLHSVGFSLELRAGDDIKEVASPSHTIRVERDSDQIRRVSLARNSDLPDRDVVLDIRRTDAKTTVLSGLDSKGIGRFAAIFPSTEFGSLPSRPRRLVLLLDRSGSMSGTPIKQAKNAIEACLGVLGEHDQFGLVTFGNGAEVFRDCLEDATAKNRQAARKFLVAVTADGGTEMSTGLKRAAELLGQQDTDSDGLESGDILIITDGQVFGTESILECIRTKGVRVHCLGIGSASQDRFLAQLAAQTGGVSRFLTPAERVDLAAVELFASIGRPVAQNVSVRGMEGARIAPETAKQVFSGTPLVIFGDSPAAKELELALTWQADARADERTLSIPFETDPIAETLRLLQGSRIISNFESRLVPASDPETKRELSRVERRLRQLSLEYGLASSQVSLVAVVKRSGDMEDHIPSTRVVPVGMPADMQFTSYFAPAQVRDIMSVAFCAAPADLEFGAAPDSALESASQASKVTREGIRQVHGALRRLTRPGSRGWIRLGESAFETEEVPPAAPHSTEDFLVSLSGMLEPDGGMPGKKQELRAANSLAVLLFFYEHGNTATAGTFRKHVEKLIQFLTAERLKKLEAKHESAALRILELINMGQPIHGSWEQFVTTIVQSKGLDTSDFWTKVESALTLAKSDTIFRE
jgi:Ca-activated chloride channel family protein